MLFITAGQHFASLPHNCSSMQLLINNFAHSVRRSISHLLYRVSAFERKHGFWFQRLNTQNHSWCSNDGHKVKEIHRVLVNVQWRTVQNCSVKFDTDHGAVIITVVTRLGTFQKKSSDPAQHRFAVEARNRFSLHV